MGADNFGSVIYLDVSIEDAFGFNNYIWALLTETVTTGEVNLDIFWLRYEPLEETANLPEPDALAVEIVLDRLNARGIDPAAAGVRFRHS